MLTILTGLIFFISGIAQSTDHEYDQEDILLKVIYSLQSDGSGFYEKGVFPSQRLHPVLNKKYEDNNIFFTGLIVLILQDAKPYLSQKSREIIDSITQRATRNYQEYKNKKGYPIYNFWRTSPSMHFPNDVVLSKLKKFKLPEDFDDTSIIYMTDEHEDELSAWLKSEMKNHTNMHRHQIQNTFEQYQEIPAYSTWFGLNMPIDFDICVHANTMSMVYDYNFELNKYDSASMFLIRNMILKNYHLTDPAYISPHYQKASTILYHVARLISYSDDDYFDPVKPRIIGDLQLLLRDSESFMESIILSSALMKLGVCPETKIESSLLESDIGSYHFFVANMASTLGNPWKKWLGYTDIFDFPYECEAYDYALILENIILYKQMNCE